MSSLHLQTSSSKHHYSTTPPTQKIYSINSDLSEAEIQKIIDAEIKKMDEEAAAKLYPDWKPGQRKRPLVTSYRLEDFEEEASGAPRWTLRDKRCGALAIKVGMMPVWDGWGERHPCTILYLDNNVVIRNKTADSPDGYTSVQIGAGERREKHIKKPQLGTYNKYGLEKYPYIVREFRVTTDKALPPEGSRIHARHFAPGQNVDISGISKGKGFQGGMKRHGFKGMPASHGTSKSHRAIGSTGQCQDPGRVFKGKKMPGRMGGVRVTKQNLRIVKIDRGRNLIYVKGAVPGNKGEFVEIRDAVKRPLFGTDKVEGGKDSSFPPLPTFPYEEGVDGSGEVGFEVMMPMQEEDPLEIIEDEAA
jgi:large subunit ribosomal protein L3